MVNCCVPGCVNYSAKSNNISYHKLSRDTLRRKSWLERIRSMPPLENCYVCSEHFSAESFEVKLRAQITGKKKQTEVEGGCHTIRVLLSSAGEEAEAA